MKKMILIVGLAAAIAGGYAQQLASNGPSVTASAAAFNWDETVYDFGSIKVGEPVSHEFGFTNNGDDSLIISSVKASCGCTVTAYTKDPVPAGTYGFVKATYNAAKPGKFSKTVTVVANTPEGSVLLTINGEVVE